MVLWKRNPTNGSQEDESKNDESHNIIGCEWIDIDNQGLMFPPNISTPLVLGLNLYQQFVMEKAMWLEDALYY